MPDHARIARRFYASRHTYLNEARVQRTMADSLLSLLADKHICFDKVLELGCGSGLFSRELIKQPLGTLYLNDLSASLCEHTAAQLATLRPDLKIRLCPGNMESLRSEERLTMIVANAVFQWASDLQGLLKSLISQLAADGVLAFSTFTAGTLEELQQAGAPSLQYLSSGELSEKVRSLGLWHQLTFQHEVLSFDSAREALRHLQNTGVNGVGSKVLSPVKTREVWRALEQKAVDAAGRVILSFNTAAVIICKQ